MKWMKIPVVKTILALAGILFLALLGLRYLAPRNSSATNPPFQVVQIGRGTMENTVSSTGTLAAVETVEVGTQVSGTISRLMIDYNDQVQKGEVLAVLDQSLFQATVKEAEAGVQKARAELAWAEDEFKRNQPLFEKGYVSEQEFLPIRIDVDTAKASLMSAEATLQRAQINLDYTVIRSPIEGTVIQRSVDAGQTVAASLSTPTLFLIAEDLSRMQIEADVDETDIGQISQGQKVRFDVQSYPDLSFTGVVRQIRLQPETISNVVTYTVIVEAPNDQALLLPGMTATVDFIVEQVESALLVPNAALRFQPRQGPGADTDKGISTSAETLGQGRVFCLTAEGRPRAVSVTMGSSDGQVTVITASALEEGATVITGLSQNGTTPERGSGFSLFGAMRGGPRP
jgi:HlyD family secretion protein